MGGRFGGDNVTVVLPGGCQCPSGPHRQDEVYLLPRLSFDGGADAESVVREWAGKSDVHAFTIALSRSYLRQQVAGWNLVDADGAPVPYSADALLSDFDTARAVADAADELYSERLLAPLVAAVSKSSPGGATAPSTSARTPSASTRRKR